MGLLVVVDPLTGTDREAPEILDACRQRRLSEGWDLALCLTDLPVYRSGTLVVADVSAKRGVAGLSLPALGATRLRPRTREATLRLAHELYARTKEPDSEATPGRGPGSAGFVGPFRRVDPPDDDMKAMDVDARYAATGTFGRLRLWAGMVLANRPWRMLPAFKGAIAAAFATGAYALVIPSLWLVADSMGWARLLALMVAAIVAMVVWIIVAHHLWERPADREQRKWAPLSQRGYRADDKRCGALSLRHPVRPHLPLGVGVRSWCLLPEHPQTPGRHRRVRDASLVGDLAGNGSRGPRGQPGARGEGARCLLRPPSAASPRGRQQRRRGRVPGQPCRAVKPTVGSHPGELGVRPPVR